MRPEEIIRYKNAYQGLFEVLPIPVRLQILSNPRGQLAADLAFQAVKGSAPDGSPEARALELMAAQEEEVNPRTRTQSCVIP